EGFDFPAFLESSDVEEARKRSKAEIIDLLRTEGERWVRWIEQLAEAYIAAPFPLPDGTSVSRLELLLGSKEHELQHRAQLTVIQRMLGLVPHFTRALPPRRGKAA